MNNKEKNQQLFTTFKQSGILEEVKLNLRKLISYKLTHQGQLNNNKIKTIEDRMIASLIYQQLSLSNCQCTQSIFIVQSGYEQSILSRQQLIQLLSFQPQDLNIKKSLLQTIVYFFTSKQKPLVHRSVDVRQPISCMEQKLKLIEKQFQVNKGKSQKEQQYLKKKQQQFRQLEISLKDQYQKDLQRFKEFQIHNIKLKIWQQTRNKYLNHIQQIQNKCTNKLQSLRLKQRAFEQQYVAKNRLLSSKNNIIQASLQQKIGIIQFKNEETQKSMQNMKKQYQIMKKDNKNQSNLLKQKIAQYNRLQLELNSKIKYQTNLAKLALLQQLNNKETQIKNKQKVINLQYDKLISMKDNMDIIKRENQRVYQQNNRLRQNLKEVQTQSKRLIGQLGNKIDRIQNLQNQLSQQKQNNKKMKESIQNYQKKNRRMEKRLTQLTQQLQTFRTEKQKLDPKIYNFESNELKKLSYQFQKQKEKRKKQIQLFIQQTE